MLGGALRDPWASTSPFQNWTITISHNPSSAPIRPDTIIAYADGSALGNPGPGGWATILTYPDGSQRTLSGCQQHSTNNRMELVAAIMALAAAPPDKPFVLFLDSNYVVQGATVWRSQWEARGWRTASGKPVMNLDLWKQLYSILSYRPLAALRWVRGHAGIEGNEAVDQLAKAEAERARDNGLAAAMTIDGSPLFEAPAAL